MGIRNLMQFLRKKVPQCIKKVPLLDMKGYKIAVDFSILLYSRMYISRKETLKYTDIINYDIDKHQTLKVFSSLLFKYVDKLLSHGITPIMIFDGENKPNEKSITKEKREKIKENIETKINNLLKEVRNPNKDPLIPINTKTAELRKLLSQSIKITNYEIECSKDILSSMGIPFKVCHGESEKSCSMLYHEGKVNAVLSNDTDVLLYEVDHIITNIIQEGNNYYALMLDRNIILKELGLTKEEFRDYCILCGCDYNKNIKKISTVNALKLIKKHKNLESLGNEMDISCLNHVKCRELFSFNKIDLPIVDQVSWDSSTLENEIFKRTLDFFELDDFKRSVKFLSEIYQTHTKDAIKIIEVSKYPFVKIDSLDAL